MRERDGGSFLGERGEVSNRRVIVLFLKELSLSIRHPFSLNGQVRESFQIEEEFREICGKAEILRLKSGGKK